jgi:hypothetical protein
MFLSKLILIASFIYSLQLIYPKINYGSEAENLVNYEVEKSDNFKQNINQNKDSQLELEFNQDDFPNTPLVDQLKQFTKNDWQFEALLSLSNSSNCLEGIDSKIINSNQSVFTREEFAYFLNECLQNLEGNLSEKLSEENLLVLQRLTEDFAQELGNLKDRIDTVEQSLSVLENQQFSPTTKLFGLTRYSYQSFFSGEGDTSDVLQYSHYMVWNTSFTGKDSLFAGFSTTRTPLPDLAPSNNGRDVGSTREGSALTAGAGNTDGSTYLTSIKYSFPVGDRLFLTVRGFEFFDRSGTFLPNFLPYYNVGDGPVSTFAQMPPIYRLGSGSGVNVNYKLSDSLVLDLSYYASAGNSPEKGKGLFNGNYITVGRLAYNPSQNFYIEGVYLNGYFAEGSFSFDNGLDFNKGFIGTGLANRFDESGVLFDQDANVSANSYMLLSYYAITPKFLIGGSVNKTSARLIGMGDADIWSYWVALTFPDLFGERNLAGFIVGMEPTLTGLRSSLPHEEFKRDGGLHLETYFRHQVNDNISITPALIWIISPNQDSQNQDILIGVVRTSFKF